MGKTILTFFLAYLGFPVSQAQNLNEFTAASQDHIQVKGTQVSLIPPANFALSQTFKGFQNPADLTSMIMVVDMPAPFSAITEGFTAEMMEPRGMKLIDKKEISIGDFEGYLIKIEQDANGLSYSKLILVYGNEQATTLINGVFLTESVETGEAISESIHTAFVNSDLVVDPRKELPFEVDETVGDLQFFKTMGNSIIFNRDGKAPTQSIDKATLIIDQSFSKQLIPDKEGFCIKRLSNYPNKYELDKKSGLNEIEIDDLSGYELTAKNLDDKEEELYQVLLFDEEDTVYFIFVGTYVRGSKKAKKDLLAVIETFRQKI